MMKRICHYCLVTCLALFLLPCASSCVRQDEFSNNPMGNFEALWDIIDSRYCFLDYKEVDWNAVRAKYQPYVTAGLSDDHLFELLGNMLSELRDGHVNLYSTANTARYWNWYQDYPRNYSEALVEDYLGRSYRIGGGLRYTILDDNVGYISYPSFSSPFGNANLSEMLSYLSLCNGLIIDVRNNGGGQLDLAERLAARFVNEKTLVGYMSHKTGAGHTDFSKPEPLYVEPAAGLRWQKPVVVLTNRHSYSATNYFASIMSCFPQVTLVGDQTGGGSGMPFSAELPNGWGVRFSACPIYNAAMQHIEFGVAPQVAVALDPADEQQGVDTMIEAARQLINAK